MTRSFAHKIALGSVQWGMKYGVANASGKPDAGELTRMLMAARTAGVSLIDTAFQYGDAENVIGELSAQAAAFEIVTKTARLGPETGVSGVAAAFRTSLERLRRGAVYGLLVHNPDILLSPDADAFWNVLEQAKSEGLVRKIGVSVYDPEQLKIITQGRQIDLVQLPCNIYDQRFIRTGAITALKSAGVEVHLRSAFLQGLLLMDTVQLPAHFDPIRAHHAAFRTWCADHGLTPVEAALRFALVQSGADKVLVGAETEAQLREILAVADRESCPHIPDEFEISAVEFINPSHWKL